VNREVSCDEQTGQWTDKAIVVHKHKSSWKDRWAVVYRHVSSREDMCSLVNSWWRGDEQRSVLYWTHELWLTDKWAVEKTQDLWWLYRWVFQAPTSNLMIPVAPVQEMCYLSPKWGTANHIYNGLERTFFQNKCNLAL